MSRSSLLVLVVARALVEATSLAIVGGLVASLGRRVPDVLPILVDTTAALLFWSVAGPLVTAPRPRAALAIATPLVAATLTVAAVGGTGDAVWPVAGVVGALYGAIVVWRGVVIAATAISWRASSWAGLAAVLIVTLGAIALPAKGGLIAIAIVAAAACAIGLSVARGAEETLASPRSGDTRGAPGWLAAWLVGVGALPVAAALPALGALLGEVASLLGPYVRELIILIATPFVYLADALVRALLALVRNVRITLPQRPFLAVPGGDEDEYARQVSQSAHLLLEGVLVALAIAVIAALVLRAVLARVIVARTDVPLDREAIAGGRLGDLLRGLFAGPVATRPSRPGGSDPHARVRRAYWDLLALAERASVGWRQAAQTPREHLATLPADALDAAREVVGPFEASRYAERADASTAERAERALREVERALASRA